MFWVVRPSVRACLRAPVPSPAGGILRLIVLHCLEISVIISQWFIYFSSITAGLVQIDTVQCP